MGSGADKSVGFERIAGIAAVFLLATALAASEIARLSQTRKSETLEARVAIAETEADAALRAVIAPDVLAEIDRSVYMVQDARGYGSAFVIDRERGILATAAHVASELRAGDSKTFVVNRHTKKPLPVVAIRIHAGYGAFRSLVEDYQPMIRESPVTDPRIVALHDLANDVALLIVDPIDPLTGENILGPALKIASHEVLLALSAGDPIAAAGFPRDVIAGGDARTSAASRVERGTIAAMIAPIDVVEDAGDAHAQNLIVHRMATAPGSSGGPVIDRTGAVIGISSHGYDSTSSNGDSVAQRAEVIFDMLEPLREEESVLRVYAPRWKKRLERWARARDVLPHVVYARYVKGAFRRDAMLKDIDLSAEPPFLSTVGDLSFGPATPAFVLRADDLDQAADRGQDRSKVAVRNAPVFEFGAGEYATVSMSLPRNRTFAFFTFDYAVTFADLGHCRTALYHRKIGSDTMTATTLQAIPSILLKADGAEGATSHQFVFRRAPCEGAASSFVLGIVHWEEPAAQPVSSGMTASLLDRPSADAPVRERLLHAAAQAQNFAHCALPLPAHGEKCFRIVRASTPD